MFIKIKNATFSFFFSLGIIALIYLILDYLSPQMLTIKYLWATMFICLILSICGSVIFKTGVTLKSLWIRRSIMMVISCVISTLFVYLFNIISIRTLANYIVLILIFTILLSIIGYIIADKIEKHSLKVINNKLEQSHNE